MSDPKLYCVDTSSFMDWQERYYPEDIFTGLVSKVDELISDKRLIAPELVFEELRAVGPAGLVKWMGKRKGIIIPTAELLEEALKIQNQFTGLRDPKAEHEEADAYVIALARMRKGIVVTQETSAAEKRNPKRTHFIPDVCRELGIPCFGFLGLIRQEGWTF